MAGLVPCMHTRLPFTAAALAARLAGGKAHAVAASSSSQAQRPAQHLSLLHNTHTGMPFDLRCFTLPVMPPSSCPALPLQVVIEVVRRRVAGEGDLSALLAPLKEPAESGEYRIKIKVSRGACVAGLLLDMAAEHGC